MDKVIDLSGSVVLTPPMTVPANSSRFMDDVDAARREPRGVVQLSWDATDPYVVNRRFDPDLIAHDESYCTSLVDLDQVVQLPTAEYFASQVLPHVARGARVVDIGCGQGEFVQHLRTRGIDAVGYDPVARQPDAHVHKRYWTPAEPPADVFVMRCVLPHIPGPWDFLRELGAANPGALVLVEFQQVEWILGEGIWYQMSHDHVNVFSRRDFEARFDVVGQGTFARGEWAWVLVRVGSQHDAAPRRCSVAAEFEALVQLRAATLSSAAEQGRPVCLWGAAGKGIVLADAMVGAGVELVAAVDADPQRQGRYMEVSGVPIISPAQARAQLPGDALVVVCNPNHLDDIARAALVPQQLVLPSQVAALVDR